MSSINSNIPQRGKDGLGGVNKVYLFPFVNYSYSQITVLGQKLTVFPVTTAYDWHSTVTSYSETIEPIGGDIAFNQNFSVQFPKTMVLSEVYKLVKQEYRAVYIDRLGNIRILGLYNGLTAKINNDTGTEKVDLNGYAVTFTGKEDNQAYFLDSISGVGITIYTVNNKVWMNGCNAIMQDDNNYIYQ
jgi:hypothetical protein